jgi:NAD+ kinase
MKIIVYSRAQRKHKKKDLLSLIQALQKFGFDFCVNEDFAQVIETLTSISIPDRYTSLIPDQDMIAMSYGGDGTFLDCVRHFQVPVLGINAGQLGFLENVFLNEISEALSELANRNFTIQKRALLFAEGDFEPSCPFAFNEFSIQKCGPTLISVEKYINDEIVATYNGDGVILSTPSGSTAYSLSVGGPIVAAECACFILSPIAPHNLTMRPIVIPDNSIVTFKVFSRCSEIIVMMDNTDFTVKANSSFKISKSSTPASLIYLRHVSFYDTLRNKML